LLLLRLIERKAHLDVGASDLFLREPGALPELAFS
jgi:hypothetical protein